MKKYCLPVVVVLSWLMMMPPPKMPPVKNPAGNYEVNPAAPVINWMTFATYRNEAACRGDLKKMPSYFKCVNQQTLSAKAHAPQGSVAGTASSPSRTH
jgi:hypothetical protein